MAFVKASMADIKQNSYIGVTAMPEADGSQRAIAIHIFTEAQRGTGEGFRAWDLRPGSTMTNATVDNLVTGTDGDTITVKYKDGEKKVIVGKDRGTGHYLRRHQAAGRDVYCAGDQRRPRCCAADVVGLIAKCHDRRAIHL
jgi:hypothetical protein